jgi:Tfp pilus assembly protein PilV
MKNRFFQILTCTFSGQSMVEALVALAAAVIIISSITVAVITSVSNTSYSASQNKATQLAREGIDAARALRDNDYAEFAEKSGVYCLGEGQTTFTEGDASLCDKKANVQNTYSRIVEFFPVGTPNNCGSVAEIAAVVSWADGKCPSSNQFCRNVKLVSCLSNPGVTP